MASIGIIYGSSTGNTRDVCRKLQLMLGRESADLLDVADVTPADFIRYRNLILAVSTWGAGDLQDDWEEFYPNLDEIDFSGKRVAVLALGDQQHYGDAFCDCVPLLVDKVTERGGTVVGFTEPEGYSYIASRAERDGKLMGLILDEDNQADQTDARLKRWISRLRGAFAG